MDVQRSPYAGLSQMRAPSGCLYTREGEEGEWKQTEHGRRGEHG